MTLRERRSAYMPELIDARCIKLLANLVATAQIAHTTDPGVDFEHPALQGLLADVSSVMEEYHASPDDIQQALQANDPQLLVGAQLGHGE